MLKFVFISKSNVSFLAFLIFFMGCDNQSYVKSYKVYKNISLNKSEQTNDVNLDFDWVKPESWIEFEGSSMRLASFHVPYSYGLGELSLFILDGDGGGLVANVNRWRGQVGLPTQTLIEINASADNRENDLGQYQIFKIINRVDFNQAFNYPNPFQDNTVFKFYISEINSLTIKIYSIAGFLVDEIQLDGLINHQFNEYSYNTADLYPGLYIAELKSDNHTEIIKLLKTK